MNADDGKFHGMQVTILPDEEQKEEIIRHNRKLATNAGKRVLKLLTETDEDNAVTILALLCESIMCIQNYGSSLLYGFETDCDAKIIKHELNQMMALSDDCLKLFGLSGNYKEEK